MVQRALNGQFQIAYVSTDFERGLAILKEQADISDFFIMEGVVVNDIHGDPVKVSTALGYAGDMMYELITPEGGKDAVYRHALARDGFDFTFHHLGMMVDRREEYDRLLEAHAAAGNEIALNACFGERSRFSYVRLPDVGHHLEYIWLDPGERHFFDEVPQN